MYGYPYDLAMGLGLLTLTSSVGLAYEVLALIRRKGRAPLALSEGFSIKDREIS
ncbi:hypothetical protein D3C84_1126260 [compost metagenome]